MQKLSVNVATTDVALSDAVHALMLRCLLLLSYESPKQRCSYVVICDVMLRKVADVAITSEQHRKEENALSCISNTKLEKNQRLATSAR